MRARHIALSLAAASAVAAGGGEIPADPVPEVNIAALPSELPPAVAAAAANVVRFTLDENGPYSSGVRIGDNRFLGAAHGFAETHRCETATVGIPTDSQPSTLSAHDFSSGQVVPLDGTVSHDWGASDHDVALVKLPAATASRLPDSQPQVIRHTSAEPLKAGELVFTLGYGLSGSAIPIPLNDHAASQRNPDAKSLTPPEVLAGYGGPAIIGGIVLNGPRDRLGVPLATGLVEYTPGDNRPRAVNRPGDSGGPVVDQAGRLVGVINYVRNDGGAHSNLAGAWPRPDSTPPGYQPALTFIEPLTPGILNELERLPATNCMPADAPPEPS